MPTIVAPENRKLAFRKRVRLNKPETAALSALLDLYEHAAQNGCTDAENLKSYGRLPADVKRLGRGVDKVAFRLPGSRYVVKVPRSMRHFGTERWREYVDSKLMSEPRIYTATPESDRHVFAMIRAERGYATVQEMAVSTLSDYAPSCDDLRRKAWRDAETVRKIGWKLGIGDLHEGNLAVRSDGSVCIIDFSR